MADTKGIFTYEPAHLLQIDVEKVVTAIFGSRLSELSKLCKDPSDVTRVFVSELNAVQHWNSSRVREQADLALSMCPDMEGRYMMALQLLIRESPHLLERYDIHLDTAPAFHEFLHRVLTSMALNSVMQTSRYFTHIIERMLALQQAIRDALATCLGYTQKEDKQRLPVSEPDPEPEPAVMATEPAAVASNAAEPGHGEMAFPTITEMIRTQEGDEARRRAAIERRGITVSELVRQATRDEARSAAGRAGVPHLQESRDPPTSDNAPTSRRKSGDNASTRRSTRSKRDAASRVTRRDHDSSRSRVSGRSHISRRDHVSGRSHISRRDHVSGRSHISRRDHVSGRSHMSRRDHDSRRSHISRRDHNNKSSRSSVSKIETGRRGGHSKLFSRREDGAHHEAGSYDDSVTVLTTAPACPLNADSATHYMELIEERKSTSDSSDHSSDGNGDGDGNNSDGGSSSDSVAPEIGPIEIDISFSGKK